MVDRRLLMPNTTQIPDVILDRWMARLTGSRFKIIMYIARRTYGFNKMEDGVSIKQMVDGIVKKNGTVLDEGTGLGRSTVIEGCAELEVLGLVKKIKSRNVHGGDEASIWALNLKESPTKPKPKKPRGKGQGDQNLDPVLNGGQNLYTGGAKNWTHNT